MILGKKINESVENAPQWLLVFCLFRVYLAAKNIHRNQLNMIKTDLLFVCFLALLHIHTALIYNIYIHLYMRRHPNSLSSFIIVFPTVLNHIKLITPVHSYLDSILPDWTGLMQTGFSFLHPSWDTHSTTSCSPLCTLMLLRLLTSTSFFVLISQLFCQQQDHLPCVYIYQMSCDGNTDLGSALPCKPR